MISRSMRKRGREYVVSEIICKDFNITGFISCWGARLLVTLAIKVYGFVSFWFWVLLAIITVMTVVYQKWDQTVIMVVLGAISFAVLFGVVWVQVTLEDASSLLKRKIIS